MKVLVLSVGSLMSVINEGDRGIMLSSTQATTHTES